MSDAADLRRRFGADRTFVGRFLLVVLTICVVVLATRLTTLWLLVFGSIVVAVLLRALADPLRRRTPLTARWAVLLSLLFILALLGLAGWFAGREVEKQVAVLSDTLPSAFRELRERVRDTPLGARFLDEVEQLGGQASRAVEMAPQIVMGTFGALTNLLLVVVAGVMLALEPQRYRDGLAALFPSGARDRIRLALNDSGKALRLWLLGQLLAMTVIGVLTGVGLWLAGVPSPLALGLLAGLSQFVPVVGPLVSAIPGLLLAAATGFDTLLWTAAIYFGVQQFESNLVTPMVQHRMVAIPMAMTLFAVIGFGMLLGPLGILFATPIAVVLFVLVKALYLRDWLGEGTEVPGEDDG